jgi:hypothetical protein
MASELLSEFLGMFGSLVILDAKGSGGVRRQLKAIPYNAEFSKRAAFVGIFDGDQAGDVAKDIAHPSLFLPGKVAPEKLLRQLIVRYGDDAIAVSLGKSVIEFRRAMGGSQGRDGHDWLHVLARHLELDPYEVVRRITRLWKTRDPSEISSFKDEYLKII